MLQAVSLLRHQWSDGQLGLQGRQWRPAGEGAPVWPGVRGGRGDESRQQELWQHRHSSHIYQGGGGGQHLDTERGGGERVTSQAGMTRRLNVNDLKFIDKFL